MKEIGFKELYEIARSKCNPRQISPLIQALETMEVKKLKDFLPMWRANEYFK
jgi:hypothetical protein